MRAIARWRLPAAKCSLPAMKRFALRIELEKLRAPLLDQVIRHDEHRLLRKPQPPHFHRGGRHRPGLPRPDDMRQQRARRSARCARRRPSGARKVTVAQKLAAHAGKRQMRAVEAAQAQVVEAVVVVARQPCARRAVLPDPLPEAVFQLLLLLARGDGFLLVDDPRPVLQLVIGRRRAAVERLLDQVRRAKPRGSVRRRVADAPRVDGIDLDRPGRDRLAWPTRMLAGLCRAAPRRSPGCRSPESTRTPVGPRSRPVAGRRAVRPSGLRHCAR